jgi:hypothetical protein
LKIKTVSFTVTVKETDLFVRAASNLPKKALRLVEKYRAHLERYTRKILTFYVLKTSGYIFRAPASFRR